MVSSGILAVMLGVSLFVGFLVLGTVLWAIKGGQFDDGKRAMDGLLFDSEKDLNDAYKRELKLKEINK